MILLNALFVDGVICVWKPEGGCFSAADVAVAAAGFLQLI